MCSKLLRIRPLSPRGRYPSESIEFERFRIVVGSDICYSIIQLTKEKPDPREFYSETEFLDIEECIAYQSLSMSLHVDHGMIYSYPLPIHVDLEEKKISNEIAEEKLFEILGRNISSFSLKNSILPKKYSKVSYVYHEYPIDLSLCGKIFCSVDRNNYALVRGLGALLKADMLYTHYEFSDLAIMSLYIALDASFQLVLRLLKESGIKNPSSIDAGRFINEQFNNNSKEMRYFEEYYEDRIRTLHPVSRFGEYPVPPLSYDDFYFLRDDLNSIFAKLVADHKW